MQDYPVISVIIPVKNNYDTFTYTLNTVLKQDYPQLQIVVSNNSLDTNIKSHILSIEDERIKYICPDKKLSFSEDWEFALNGADGEYVTFLGADDGMLPGALNYGIKLIKKYKVDAFTWTKINYNWPNHIRPNEQNVIEGTAKNTLQIFHGGSAIKLLSKFRIGYNQLPCIYNSLINRNIIDKVREDSKSKTFFSGVIPDVYSSIVISSNVNKYLFSNFPLTVNAASNKSSGVIQGESSHTEDQKSQISDALYSGDKYHKDIGSFSSSIYAIVMGEYLLAKDNLINTKLPKPNWRSYVSRLIKEALLSKNTEAIMASAKHTIRSRRMLMRIPKVKSIKSDSNENYYNIRLKLPKNIINNVDSFSELIRYTIPLKSEIQEKENFILLRNWLSYSKKTFAQIYRNIILKP